MNAARCIDPKTTGSLPGSRTGKWQLACGPRNLGEGLHEFRVWASDIRER